MLGPKVVLTLAAERDLDALFTWITDDSGPDRAEAVLRRIEHTVEQVAAMPRIGRLRRDLDGAPRTFAAWPWIIVYEPLPTGEGVVIWRVVDGRRDLPNEVGS